MIIKSIINVTVNNMIELFKDAIRYNLINISNWLDNDDKKLIIIFRNSSVIMEKQENENISIDMFFNRCHKTSNINRYKFF